MSSLPATTLVVRDYIVDDTTTGSSHPMPQPLVEYADSFERMRELTAQRDAQTPDELWLLEHSPVYTLGRNADPGHIINPGEIPVIEVDRGGQVTYHGPGQIMCYLMADISRLGLQVRSLVEGLEQAVVDVLAGYGVSATGNRDAPGVYVDGAKIAALGLRVSRGRCYHGLCFNHAFDATPFVGINPCGFESLAVTQLAELLSPCPPASVLAMQLAAAIGDRLGYECVDYTAGCWAVDGEPGSLTGHKPGSA